MRLLLAWAAGLLLTWTFSFSAGAAEATSVSKDAREALTFMAGKWEPGPTSNPGPMQTVSDERRWAPGKHCLIITWSGVKDGAPIHASGIMGWNRTLNQLTEHWYVSDGTWFEVCYPLDKMNSGVWSGTARWVEPDGKKVAGVCRLERGQDQFTWTLEWTEGPTKHVEKSVSRRAKEQTATREDFQEYCRLVCGRWYNGDEKLASLWPSFGPKDAKMVSHSESRITADGNAPYDTWYGGTGMISGMAAWDPASRQIREFAVASDGTFWEGVRSKQGDGWLCTVTLTRPNGKQEKVSAILKFSADGKTHSYHDPAGANPPAVYQRAGK